MLVVQWHTKSLPLLFCPIYDKIITIIKEKVKTMANFTEAAIKKAFIDLLNRKPLSKITVKDISGECGINRNSFYYHYSDIPTLLEEVLTEEAAKLIIPDPENNTIYQQLMAAIDFAYENKTAVYHIYKSANREMFETYLDRISRSSIEHYISKLEEQRGEIVPEDRAVLVMYFKCMLVGFVIDWLGNGMKYDIREKLYRACQLFEGTSQTAFDRAKKKSDGN